MKEEEEIRRVMVSGQRHSVFWAWKKDVQIMEGVKGLEGSPVCPEPTNGKTVTIFLNCNLILPGIFHIE